MLRDYNYDSFNNITKGKERKKKKGKEKREKRREEMKGRKEQHSIIGGRNLKSKF